MLSITYNFAKSQVWFIAIWYGRIESSTLCSIKPGKPIKSVSRTKHARSMTIGKDASYHKNDLGETID